MERSELPPISRRRFLKGAGVAGAAAVIPSVHPSHGADARFRAVYRLSGKRERVCRACRSHDRFRYYRLPRFAKNDRAHHGCNCDVIAQQLPTPKWQTFFVRTDGTLRKVWDRRWTT